MVAITAGGLGVGCARESVTGKGVSVEVVILKEERIIVKN
jgi:hypothetical protein